VTNAIPDVLPMHGEAVRRARGFVLVAQRLSIGTVGKVPGRFPLTNSGYGLIPANQFTTTVLEGEAAASATGIRNRLPSAVNAK